MHQGIIRSLIAAGAVYVAAAPSLVVAEGSQVPVNNAFGLTIDPQASGTKLNGYVTLSFDIEFDTQRANLICNVPSDGKYVLNLYVVATMQNGSTVKHFSSDYNHAGLALQDCLSNQEKQVQFLRDHVLATLIIPAFFPPCGANCPAYAIKRLSQAESTISAFVQNPVNRDSYVFEIELAVKN